MRFKILHLRFYHILIALIVMFLIGFIAFYIRKNKSFISDYRPDSDVQKCLKLKETAYKQCFADIIQKVADKKGALEAAHFVAQITDQYPQIKSSCHDYMHIVGKNAYFQYRQKKVIEVSADMNLCGFGWYHGLTETLISVDNNLLLAKEICNSLEKQKVKASINDCYHGIGHGYVLMKVYEKVADPWNFVDPGILFCEKLSLENQKLDDCVSGVIDGIASLFTKNEFVLKEDTRKNPLGLCYKMKDRYKYICYSSLNWLMLNITNDFGKSTKFTENIINDEYAKTSIANMAFLSILRNPNKKDYKDEIHVCQQLQYRLKLSCLKGLVKGIYMWLGTPKNEYVKALDFCNDKDIADMSKDECISEIIDNMRRTYPKNDILKLCQSLSVDSRDKCISEFR